MTRFYRVIKTKCDPRSSTSLVPMSVLSFVDCHFIINMILIFMHYQGTIFQFFELD